MVRHISPKLHPTKQATYVGNFQVVDELHALCADS